MKPASMENMLSWHPSGCHGQLGARIWPDVETGLENLAEQMD